jgi:hypothetical protein
MFANRISDPDLFSSIPDPTTTKKEWGSLLSYLFCSHKFHELEKYFIFEQVEKIFLANWQIIIGIFSKKMSLSSEKYGFEIRHQQKYLSWIPVPGVIKSTWSWISDPDPQQWLHGPQKAIRNDRQKSKLRHRKGFNNVNNVKAFGFPYRTVFHAVLWIRIQPKVDVEVDDQTLNKFTAEKIMFFYQNLQIAYS